MASKQVVVQGTVHALRTIAASEGASGLLRGFWPTVISNAPFSALYYMLYSDLRQRFQKVGSTIVLHVCISQAVHFHPACQSCTNLM